MLDSTRDPPVSVHGVTPVHTYSRLLSIAADGHMAVFDIYTGAGCPVWCSAYPPILSRFPQNLSFSTRYM